MSAVVAAPSRPRRAHLGRLVVLETRRLLLRRGTLLMSAAVVATTVLFGYVLVSALEGLALQDPALDETSRRELSALAQGSALSGLPSSVVSVAKTFVVLFALVLGSAVTAEDGRSGFGKLVIARGTSRRLLVAARAGALGLAAGGGTLLMGITAAVAAGTVGAHSSGGPPLDRLALTLGVVAAVWWTWSLIGLLLTVATRSGHAAVALGVAVLMTGSAVVGAASGTGLLERTLAVLPVSLADRALTAAATGQADALGWPLAGLLVYGVGAVLLTIRTFARRDLR